MNAARRRGFGELRHVVRARSRRLAAVVTPARFRRRSADAANAGAARPIGAAIPFWLRPRATPRPRTAVLTPREGRWWIGAIVLTASIALLSFVAHVTLFGVLQEGQTQRTLYQQLRENLANGVAPLGPTDVNNQVVPDGTGVALLTIPKLGLSAVVVQGTSPGDLRAGPGHRRDSVMPGQVGTSIIYGRQSLYGAPFRHLGELVPGDQFTVVTGQGASVFKVIDVRVPGDREPTTPTSTESRVQLVSASGPALAPDSVVYVDAVRTKPGLEAASPIIASLALNPGENVMQTDPNAMLPFLFALQWLLIACGLAIYLSRRWGRWQTWIVGAPVVLLFGALTADAAVGFLPNLV